MLGDRDYPLSIADEWALEMQRDFGGSSHYVPAPDNSDRNQQIIEEWHLRKGEKGIQTKLAREFHVDQSTVSRIITKHLEGRLFIKRES